MQDNNRQPLHNQDEQSRQGQTQQTGTHLNAEQGQEKGRGSYGSGREQNSDLQQNTSVERGQQGSERSAQSSSLEDDGRIESPRSSEERTDRNDVKNPRTGSL